MYSRKNTGNGKWRAHTSDGSISNILGFNHVIYIPVLKQSTFITIILCWYVIPRINPRNKWWKLPGCLYKAINSVEVLSHLPIVYRSYILYFYQSDFTDEKTTFDMCLDIYFSWEDKSIFEIKSYWQIAEKYPLVWHISIKWKLPFFVVLKKSYFEDIDSNILYKIKPG